MRKILTESKLAEENSINVQEDVDRLELKWAENGFGLNKIEDCVLAVQFTFKLNIVFGAHVSHFLDISSKPNRIYLF